MLRGRRAASDACNAALLAFAAALAAGAEGDKARADHALAKAEEGEKAARERLREVEGKD